MYLRALVLALGGLAPAAPAAWANAGLEEVEACLRRNLPEKSSVQTVALRAVDRTGSSRTLQGELSWKRTPDDLNRALLRIREPADMRGSAYLLIEHEGDEVETFVFLPELGRVRRITPHSAAGSLFGTDFSYEDLRYLRRVATEAKRERLPDAQLEGRPVYVVRITPAEEDSSRYEHILGYVDRETCVPLKMEFYERGERLRKVLTADPAKIQRHAGLYVPHATRLRDLREETETSLVIEDTQVDVDLPDRLFTQTQLARGH